MVNIYRGPEGSDTPQNRTDISRQQANHRSETFEILTDSERAAKLQLLTAQLNSRRGSKFNAKTKRAYETWCAFITDPDAAEKQLEQWIRSAKERKLQVAEITFLQQAINKISDGSDTNYARQRAPRNWAVVGPDGKAASEQMGRSDDQTDMQRAA